MRWLLTVVPLIGAMVACGGDGNDRADTVATVVQTPTALIAGDADPTSTEETEPESTATESQEYPTEESTPTIDTSPTGELEETATAEPEPTDETPPTATEEPVASSEDLEATLLSLEDLPVGWTTWDRGEDDDEPGLGICDVPSLEEQFNPAADAAVDFQKGELGPFLTQATAQYESTDVAEEVMQYVRSTLTCTEWTDINDEGQETVWTISPLSFPTIGDDTFVLRMSANAGIAILEFDLVYLRVGDVVTGVGHIGVNGVDSEQTVQFSELAAEKIE